MPLITEYNPDWPAWFERLREVIAGKLGSTFFTIEHFGSTSVPGMVAKPLMASLPPTLSF